MRILLVEDDESIVDVLTVILTERNYRVDVARDGQAGWEIAESQTYDLILLDVGLPKLDGISVCRRLRQVGNQVLVMLMTARDTTTDKLFGLDAGADDYVVKPFNLQELTARIRALLRRRGAIASPILEWGCLSLDPNTRGVTYEENPLQFSHKEFQLLELFLQHPNRVFSRSAIVNEVWSLDETPPNEDTVKSHIKSIRRKLDVFDARDLIETLYGQGYRLNPDYRLEKPQTAQLKSSKQDTLDLAVSQIWQRTKGSTLERLDSLQQMIYFLQSGTLDQDLLQRVSHSAHKLAGSLGTFGFPTASRLAQQLETLLQSKLPQEVLAQKAQQLITSLYEALTEEQGEGPEDAHTPNLAAPILSSEEWPLLLIVDQDRSLAERVAKAAHEWKIRTEIATDPTTARGRIAHACPDVILLDTPLNRGDQESMALLKEIADSDLPVPVIVFSEQENANERLALTHLEGRTFLQKPAPINQILRAVNQVLQAKPATAKILAVDDDPEVIAILKSLLEPQGIELIGLEDPTRFWETLKLTQPDLLILDISMPEVSGLDLCRLVRSDFELNWLPIFFLTAQDDFLTLERVFKAGADDFLTKVLISEELVTRVLNRLQQSRMARSQLEVDLLTGLANQHRATQSLNQLLHLANRSQQPVCLAVLDLDGFKRVNDLYGFVQGDKVLRQFGCFLQQQFRAGDVVARWGRGEFVVGMYGIRRDEGVERLAEILEDWRSQPLTTSDDKSLSISFSAGLAQYPVDGAALQMLYRTADAMLYQAKYAGRNRILSAAWRPLCGVANAQLDVLLIHPENESAHPILWALETRGYHTRWLRSGREAIAALTEDNPRLKVRLILLSEDLSDIGGLSVLKQLGVNILQQTRTIFILNNPDLVESAQALGIFDYVLAPLNVKVLMQRLRQTLMISS